MNIQKSPLGRCGMKSEMAVENLKAAYKDGAEEPRFGPSAVIDLFKYEPRFGKSSLMNKFLADMKSCADRSKTNT